jgi:transposase, IS5 family
MNTVVPWARLEALIEPHHPKSGKVRRPPIGVPRMLRMYFLQQWYTLADEALEDAPWDGQAMREFIDLTERGLLMRQGTVVDATIIAAPVGRRTKTASVPPRCTRRRRAGNGTSA